MTFELGEIKASPLSSNTHLHSFLRRVATLIRQHEVLAQL